MAYKVSIHTVVAGVMGTLAALFVLSCSQKSELDPMPDSIRNPLSGDGDVWYPCTVSFSQEEGKSVLSNRHLTWESDDQVGVFVRNGSTNVCTNLKGDVYTDVSPRQFKFFSPVALSAGYKVYAYSPFSGEAGSNPTAVSLTLPAEQTQMIGTITAGGSGASGWRKAADEHFDGSSLPMVSIPVTLSAGSAVDTWTADATHFCNIASLVCFRVYSSDASYRGSILGGNEFHFVTQIKFALTSGTGVSGTGTVDLTALTESSGDSAFALKGASGTSVSVKTGVPVASSKDDATPIYMALLPGTWTGTLTITTVIGDFVFNLSGKQFKRSEMKTINVDLNNATVKPEPGLKGTKVDSYTAIRGKQASVGSKVLKDSDFGSGSHYYFYGIVVGDCDNANMDQNLQCGTTVDGLDVKTQLLNEAGQAPNANDIYTTENDRTNYLQSDGASYGFRLKFASPKQNIYKRGDKLFIYLAGLTLINEGTPTRYTLVIPENAKILVIDRWSETTLNNHSNNYATPVAISSLTPEMIYTNVRISDVEFQVKRGCYANVREYDAILNPINKGLAENDARYGANNNYAKDGAANLLYDGSGKGIYMLLNMNSDWRWDASARVRKQVPQGTGTISGILVHQPMERWGGNVGAYSIRPLKEEDIVCTGTSSWHDWVEWTYNHIDDVSNSKYYWNDNTATAGGYVSSSGDARFRQNKLNAVAAAGMVNETGSKAQFYCENTSDWGSSDTWRVIPVYVDRGFDVSSFADAYKDKDSMKNKHHHFGLVASGIHYKVNYSGFYDWSSGTPTEGSKGFVAEFTTTGLSGHSAAAIGFSIAGGLNTLYANPNAEWIGSSSFPIDWKVQYQYSTDGGTSWSAWSSDGVANVATGVNALELRSLPFCISGQSMLTSFLDSGSQSPVYTNSDWGFGLVPYRFRLPAAVLGKSRVRVRIVPSSLRMAEWNSGGDPNWARGQTYRARSIVQNFTYTGAGGITLEDVQIQYK